MATFGLVTIDGFQKISMEKGDFVTDSVVQRISEIISMGYFKDGVSYVRRSVDEFARIASGTFAFHFPSEAAEDSEKRLKSLVDIISKHASFREMDGSRFRVSISVRYVSIPGEMLPVPDTGSIEGVSP